MTIAIVDEMGNEGITKLIADWLSKQPSMA
jgi:hypothetical protein